MSLKNLLVLGRISDLTKEVIIVTAQDTEISRLGLD